MLRDLLLKRVRPLVEALAEDIVNIAVTRIESELGRLAESCDIALSAYAGDVPEPAPALDVTEPLTDHAANAAAERVLANYANKRTKREMAAAIAHRDVKPDNEILPGLDAGIAAMKTAVDAMLGPPNHRPPPPEVTTSGKPRQRAVMRCRKCGKLGARADGCGTAHESAMPDYAAAIDEARAHPVPRAPSRTLKPTAAALEAASVRIKGRIASIAASASRVDAAPKRNVDDNPTADERWTEDGELAAELARLGDVAGFEDLIPSSSWSV